MEHTFDNSYIIIDVNYKIFQFLEWDQRICLKNLNLKNDGVLSGYAAIGGCSYIFLTSICMI